MLNVASPPFAASMLIGAFFGDPYHSLVNHLALLNPLRFQVVCVADLITI